MLKIKISIITNLITNHDDDTTSYDIKQRATVDRADLIQCLSSILTYVITYNNSIDLPMSRRTFQPFEILQNY